MEEAFDKKLSRSIDMGAKKITIDIPEDAKDVDLDSIYTVTYCLGDIEVNYSNSFCDSEEKVLKDLWETYEIYADESDHPSNIKPMQTMVGRYNAYYCRTVDFYPDEPDAVYYFFMVEIEESCYLEVTLDGDEDKLTEARAFELADVNFRWEPGRKSLFGWMKRKKMDG